MIENYNGIQYTGTNGYELNKWSGGTIVESPILEPTKDNPTGAYLQVYDSCNKCEIAKVDDWIIRDNCGTFFILTPEEFEFYISLKQ